MKRTIKRNGEVAITMDFNEYTKLNSLLYVIKTRYETVKNDVNNGFETENETIKNIKLYKSTQEFEEITQMYNELQL